MSTQNLLVASIADPALTGKVIDNLNKAGFDLKRWSLVAAQDTRSPGDTLGAENISALNALGNPRYSCIPHERIADYESELHGNRLLLVAQGSAEEIDAAKHIIDQTHPCEWDTKVGAAVFYGCNV